MAQQLTVSDCKLVLQSLLSAELSAYRGIAIPYWQEPADIDSLELLHLASCVNEFFCLHETGAEDRLLMTKSLDDWAALVAHATCETSGLMFRTSGSTGNPTSHHHKWEHIKAEVDSLAFVLLSSKPIKRVVSWLPLHHLYGFMLGMAFPAMATIPQLAVTDAVLPKLSSGDLLVTVPPRWEYLARSRRAWEPAIYGVCSTGELSEHTGSSLLSQGLSGLLDIYGSTETGGIAARWLPETSYQLLKHWQPGCDAQHIQRENDGAELPLLDNVEWDSERHFVLKGRLDEVISIGGVNVSVTYVGQKLRALESVADCTVRVAKQGTQLRLKAFVIPRTSEDETATEINNAIKLWPAAERPVQITYGADLPTNEMGKLTDW
ncbi:AMP-binding protein [Rheinheimera soli]|uniref:4-coumarate--CoA ligase n=1 Tax=Rheinheimera soli TaxID=443616 RepID=A0ABU1VV28_9GAMM|nr:AMP-binding protein [Rheinheimera soli]MDR7119547.1 4-coumarate--CoA ligase [Rheinheimera soli]